MAIIQPASRTVFNRLAAGVLCMLLCAVPNHAQTLPNHYFTTEVIPLELEKRSEFAFKVIRDRGRMISDLIQILKEIDEKRALSKKYKFDQQLDALHKGVEEANTQYLKEIRKKGIDQFLLTRDDLAACPEGRETLAIRLLGQLRAAESVPHLLSRIDLIFTYIGSIRNSPYRPIHDALVLIGKPASRGAVECLAKEEPRITRGPGIATEINSAQLYVNVIAEIEGIELGKAMVRLATEKETDPKKKQRLQAALDLFKDVPSPVP